MVTRGMAAETETVEAEVGGYNLVPARLSSSSSCSRIGVGAFSVLSFIRFLAREDLEFSLGFLRMMPWSVSIRISCRARLIPCCTSCHWSVSSRSTELVTRGVAGTTSYC